MPAFQFLVVGSGGGPDETNLSGYLVKTYTSSWGEDIIALEAGSGLGALKRILEQSPSLLGDASAEDEPKLSAAHIYSTVRAFLITHSHLDHVMSLVLHAGSYTENRVKLISTGKVLQDIETIFRPKRLWPNLASWNRNDPSYMYLYDPLEPTDEYKHIHGDISARIMPVSHGSNHDTYWSSAFFIRNDTTMHEFLFFGDVEPDSVATNPQTIYVWRAAAEMIPDRLKAIFIECSWPSGRTDSQLFGHLTPEHFMQELENLAKEVVGFRMRVSGKISPRVSKTVKSNNSLHGVLQGLRVYVIHCKEDLTGVYTETMQDVIVKQIRVLASAKKLGVEILPAVQGALIDI